jgi:integrase
LESKRQLALATKRSYQQVINEFLEYLGEAGSRRRLEAITEKDIQGFIVKLRASGRIPSTINKLVRNFLSVPFEKARKLGKIKYNPVMACDPEKGTVAVKQIFSPEQIARLLSVASDDWQGAIIAGYTIGARLGDIANLRWSSLDLEYGVVTFTEKKTGRSTLVGLHENFTEWLSVQPAPEQADAFVFASLAQKNMSGLSAAFSDIMKKAGVEGKLIRESKGGKSKDVRGLSFHSLRHGAASSVFNQAALKEVARRVTGHTEKGSLNRYLHADLQAIREASKLIPRIPKS